MSSSFNHCLFHSPVRPGVAIQNPVVGNYGTIGFIGTSDGADRWLVSCYHVLCRLAGEMPPETSEPIFYPLDLEKNVPVAIVTSDRVNTDIDCAAALIPDGIANSEILGIGRLSAPASPEVGMRVLKSGAETGVTEGRILRVTEREIEVAPFGMPDRFELSEGGDSGSVWVDAATHAAVALHFKGSERGTPERAIGRPIKTVLECLRLEFVFE